MSLNDPRWGDDDPRQRPEDASHGPQQRPSGQRPDDGPPDLDEVWREFNERLNALFGGKGGGRRPRGPLPGGSGGDPRRVVLFIGLLAVAALALWLASGFYKVEANERAVVLRFGKYFETTEPGLRWRLPWPIESHQLVDFTGVRTVEVGYRGSERNKNLREALMLTDDENIVTILFAVQYRLKSPEDYLFRDRAPDETVKQVAESAMREIVGKNKMDFVLYEGREEIAVRTQALMQQMLDRYQTGIQIVRVTLQNAQPPEQVQAAFDDAVKAGQDRERLRNEGEAYANAVIPRARGTASRMIEEAQAYKSRVIAQAEGDTQRFLSLYEQYRQSPALTRERLYLETMQQVFTHTSKVLVDVESSNNLLMLPLAELLGQKRGAGSAAPASDASQSPEDLLRDAVSGTVASQNSGMTSPITGGLDRSRDTGRTLTRDRENRP
uniref:Protein HflK n=1 Tax=uncultured beta proteobacterium TaxID=86027 RepID=H5SGV6_9PROT|nr:membrane protease subunit HflK [uncultured beta proteobacterium]